MPGSSSWMPYAPQGVNGLDDETLNLSAAMRLCNVLSYAQCSTVSSPQSICDK